MIVIFCPAANATGGTELLHQLGYKLGLFGFDARMYYCGDSDGRPVTHPRFVRYGVPVIDTVKDDPGNVFVYPENMVSSLGEVKEQLPLSKHVLWWLSVDNACMTGELEKEISDDKALIHLVQSYYAEEYVRSVLSVPEERLYYLSDYLNYDFLCADTDGAREDVVLFNPRKGFERTAELIGMSNHRIRWRALAGLAPDEVPGVLKTAKVYVDFGNHPGKDRFPREAVMCGCRIVTGRRGAAANSRDIPIPDQLKVDDDADSERIVGMITSLIENYDRTGELYDEYKKIIKEEFRTFEADALSVFAKITGTGLKGADDREHLKADVLDAVSKEDYAKAFYDLTVYRIRGYEPDEQMIILEGYTRLGIGEEEAALYLMNGLLEKDEKNYEAHLIKARSLMALSRPGAGEELDLAARHSKGTDDEQYVADAVRMLKTGQI